MLQIICYGQMSSFAHFYSNFYHCCSHETIPSVARNLTVCIDNCCFFVFIKSDEQKHLK